MELAAYYFPGGEVAPLAVAPRTRKWLPPFGYRCTPLLVANEAGWMIVNRVGFDVLWDGDVLPAGLRVLPWVADRQPLAESHFGHGILTFRVPFLFRTPPFWSLYVRGPANHPKHGIQALEGIVETDMAYESFTMNWAMTAPGQVRFEVDEPFAQVSPWRRGELEQFEPVIRPITGEPELLAAYEGWHRSRGEFIAEHHGGATGKHGDYASRVEQASLKLRAPRVDNG